MRKGDKCMNVFGVIVILAIIVSVFGGVVLAEDVSRGLKQSVDDAGIQTAVGNLSSEELAKALDAETDDTVTIEFADQSAELGVVSSRSSYDPQAAVNYATNYAYKACGCGKYYGSSPPPQGSGTPLGSDGDCAHFVSHCLAAGGLSNKGTAYATGWCEGGAQDYIISVSKMRQWFTDTGIANKVSSLSQLEPGDVIVTNNYGHVVLYIGTYGGNTNRVASHSAWGIFSYAYFGTPNEYWHIITSKACTPNFNIGDTVEVDASPYSCLKVREGPGTGYPAYKCEPNGVVGVILDANPVYSADGCWVEVRYCDGIQGYSVQEGLKDKYIAPSTKFGISDTVYTTAVLSVRTDPPELVYSTEVPEGTGGTILDGPRYGPPKGKSGCYNWWKVEYEGGTVGWSAEDYLEKGICQHKCWDRSALPGNELADLVREHFPLGTVPQTGESIRVTAYAVAKAESGGNPSACGDNDKSIGLWQIHTGYHPEYDKCRLFEEDYNAEAAKQISNDGCSDWNPWCTWEETACGGNGDESYKNYLVEARNHFYPKVTSLSVSSNSISSGESVNIYYSVSDDVGLSRVELWRIVDKNKNPDPDDPSWEKIETDPISGTGYSDHFTDTPTPPDIYWYGIHVADNSGAPEAWNDERNSRTGGSPGVFGPIRVEVTLTPRTITFYTDPTAGTLTFDGSTYSNGHSTTKIDGTYSVSANPASNYEFDHWSTVGGVSVTNLNSQSTTATVSGDGNIKAWFNIPSACDGTATSCGIYPNCEDCNEDDGCYPYGNGCEERDYYCISNEAGCGYTYSNRHTDGWVDTGNTKWVPDSGNDCQEKEQKEQKYRDYYCSGSACTYGETGTQWVDTGTTQNKPDGTICGCTASNTLKRCYGGVCTDTGICDSTTCGADAACDGKEPGDSCGGGTCDSNCKCGVSAVGEDYGVFRNGRWWISKPDHSGTDYSFKYGISGDKPVVGDITGDGSDDIAIFRNGWWWVSNADHSGTAYNFKYGISGDIPVVGDINNDGSDDVAIFRNGWWYVSNADHSGTADVFKYGISGDIPVVGDIDNDGSDDVAIFRDGWWWVSKQDHSGTAYVFKYGISGDIPVVGDITGDGSDDVAIFRNGWWWVSNAAHTGTADVFKYGISSDIPVVGDI